MHYTIIILVSILLLLVWVNLKESTRSERLFDYGQAQRYNQSLGGYHPVYTPPAQFKKDIRFAN